MVDRLRKEYLVCYDIQDNKIRRKLSVLLLDLGLRDIQKSVYWGFLSKTEIAATFRKSEELLASGDKLLITPIQMKNREKKYIGHDEKEFQDWSLHECI